MIELLTVQEVSEIIMSILEIIYTVVIGVIALAFIIYWVVKIVKNGWLDDIIDTINTAVVEAETKYPESGSGDKKLSYVLEKVEAKCKELGIPFSLIKALVVKTINSIIGGYNVITKSDDTSEE